MQFGGSEFNYNSELYGDDQPRNSVHSDLGKFINSKMHVEQNSVDKADVAEKNFATG